MCPGGRIRLPPKTLSPSAPRTLVQYAERERVSSLKSHMHQLKQRDATEPTARPRDRAKPPQRLARWVLPWRYPGALVWVIVRASPSSPLP